MKFFYSFKGYRFKHYVIILVAALFSSILLYVEKDQLAVFSTDQGPRAIDSVETKEKKVALTFDISWGEKRAIPILNLLKKYKINETTFFLSGSWAERHPEIVERIAKDGHEIGNLGFQYEHYTNLETDQISKDIQLSDVVLKELTNKKPTLLRPPNGSFDERVLTVAEKFNYTVVHWSVNSEDWKNPGTDQIVKNVVKKTEGGDIVLFHASDSAKQTEKALPQIIEHFQKEGFRFVTVSELIANSETKSEEIK
ncbi:polysaccharide deacetylase family sporulation protein PdaB [Pueribacillus theae]|uniref:Polysaccharide deacetylase family sporulation protein PdaB n=1 Tax=Pueribacillus theae TaxID=2171751 RepID=A0A2U1K7K3_9BACI|nr:polysaccharide deacetylase family sporulation protein PdaB [Pueribacillus theae]PWA12868.1 polysaccharide deacetylase family sporulation protein PdaB [Pueribacillus theae]